MSRHMVGWWLLLSVWLWGSPLDFYTLHKAESAYKAGRYVESARLYDKLAKTKGDSARLNAGDAWYKAGDYAKAKERFEKITDRSLRFQKWHNLGNTYAHLGKIERAIEAYKKALKIKDDPDTRYNLQLLQKAQKKRKKSSSQQNGAQKKRKQKEKKSHKSGSKRNNQQNKKSSDKKRDQNKKENKKSSKKAKNGHAKEQKRQQKKTQKSERNRQKAQQMQQHMKEEPISDMELRKWEKMLKQRRIRTLMLPMNRSEQPRRSDDAIHPW